MSAVNYFKSIKLPVVLLTVVFLIFGFVCTGMLSHASMHNSSTSVAAVMPADNQQCCNTGISKHIDQWKNSLLILPKESRDGLTLLILGFALIFGYAWVSFWNRKPPIDLDVGRLRLYIREHLDLILFNHLKLAFARGILNPKIF